MGNNKQLLNFINETNPDKLQVEEDFGLGYVRLNTTEAQKRQAKDDIRDVESVLIEMLRNSRDANASTIYVASWKQNSKRNLVVIDNGEGIPGQMKNLVFEPRVTSKLNQINYDTYGLHGRGMALYSTAVNCEYTKVTYSKPGGKLTAIKVVADNDKLPEKANQSTWPSFDSSGSIKDGPHNLIRKSVEFNLANKKLDIFLGTQTEILSEMFKNDEFDFKKKSAKSIYEFAKVLELDISLRNCQRVFHKQISLSKSILSTIEKKSTVKTNRALKSPAIASFLGNEELENILKETKYLVDEKGKKSFIRTSEDANINKVGNNLVITLPLEIEE